MERPILFSTPMIQAILNGRKTQTRRVVKGQPLDWLKNAGFTPEFVSMPENNLCPYGKPGDVLWVRETFQILPPNMVFYKADKENKATGNWKPSIFMPRGACRIKLLIKNIRVEKLQDISEEDAKAEGAPRAITWAHTCKIEVVDEGHVFYHAGTHKLGYSSIWETINGKGSWEKNPWIWVITFERIQL